MNKIMVVCTNPEQMRLRVTAEFTIGEWKEILAITDKVQYYAPLKEFISSISRAIKAIEDREDVTMKMPGQQ
jgi:hypothetical protein